MSTKQAYTFFRRNKFIQFATFAEFKRGENYDIALRENRILEKYFPTALENSTHLWTPELRQTVDKKCDERTGIPERRERWTGNAF